jgi:SDR family mycofactocin-dependent oxidoreductase
MPIKSPTAAAQSLRRSAMRIPVGTEDELVGGTPAVGRVEGRVAFVTGAARGQGRAIAIRLAEEGADIIAVDIAAPVETAIGSSATEQDLVQTAEQVEALGRRAITARVDVRDYLALKSFLEDAAAELGHVDIIVANAGILSYGLSEQLTDDAWQTMIDIVLTGVWHTTKAAIPILKAQGTGGSIIISSSVGGLAPYEQVSHYVAAKHGVVGLMRTLALELGPFKIRVNTVNPTTVNTPMSRNSATYELFAPDLAECDRTMEALLPRFQALHALPIPWVEPEDIANAVLWLASDESRYVSGITLPVDGASLLK